MKFSPFPIALGLLVPSFPAVAQTGNVNDCTLIKDAIELRDCILRYGNVRTQPPATIESPGPAATTATDPAPSVDSEIVEVPSSAAGRKTPAKRSDKAAPKRPVAHLESKAAPQAPSPPTPPLPKPNPKDTLTHIEQIDLSKVKP